MKPVTIWYRLNPDNGEFEHNHIEEGHSNEDQPIPINEAQKKRWLPYLWMGIHAILSDDKKVVSHKSLFYFDNTHSAGYWAIRNINKEVHNIWIDCPRHYIPTIVKALNKDHPDLKQPAEPYINNISGIKTDPLLPHRDELEGITVQMWEEAAPFTKEMQDKLNAELFKKEYLVTYNLTDNNKAEKLLEKHVNDHDLNFMFHDQKQMYYEVINALKEALTLSRAMVTEDKLCGSFEPDNQTSSATTCKHCGREKFIHPQQK